MKISIVWIFCLSKLIISTTYSLNVGYSDPITSTTNANCTEEVEIKRLGNSSAGTAYILSSPEFPLSYSRAQFNCSWIEYKLVNDGGFIRLVFDDFILDAGGYDYVQIGTNKYKETDRPYPVVVNNSLSVIFYFDEIAGDGVGWKASAEFVTQFEWVDIPSEFGINSSSVTKENSLGGEFQVKSTGERIYLDITWIIRVPEEKRVMFNIIKSELKSNESMIHIHDGLTSESELVKVKKDSSFISSGSTVYVRLKSWLEENGDAFICSYAAFQEEDNCDSINSFKCYNHGLCIDSTLVCDGVNNCGDFSDEMCPTKDPNECLCQNGGKCHPDYINNTIICYCPTHYRGIYCEIYDTNCPYCYNGGTCTLWPNLKYSCACHPGYNEDTRCRRGEDQWSIILIVSVTLLCLLFVVFLCVCVASFITRKSTHRRRNLRRRRNREEQMNPGYIPERTADMPPAYDECISEEGDENDSIDGRDNAEDTNSYIRPPPSPSPSMEHHFFPDAPPPPYSSRDGTEAGSQLGQIGDDHMRTPLEADRQSPPEPASPNDERITAATNINELVEMESYMQDIHGGTRNRGTLTPVEEVLTLSSQMPPQIANTAETLRSNFSEELADKSSDTELPPTVNGNNIKTISDNQKGKNGAKEETLV